jgi:hypothetical protein
MAGTLRAKALINDTGSAVLDLIMGYAQTWQPTCSQTTQGHRLHQSLSAFVKSICDVMRRSNCASALQYVPELTWILFLRILDAQEARDPKQAEAVGAASRRRCAAPTAGRTGPRPSDEADKPGHPKTPEGKPFGWKRQELFAAGDGKLFDFINKDAAAAPAQSGRGPAHRPAQPGASPKQRIIGRIMTAVERVRVDSETNLRDILDKVHEISIDHIDDQHFFTLSQVYEDLLLKMGEKNSDGGQFFTPREVIRAMVHTREPLIGADGVRPLLRHRRLSGHCLRAHRAQAGQRAPAPTSTPSSTTPSLAARRRTWCSPSRWPTWCCTASTSPTCGTATR